MDDYRVSTSWRDHPKRKKLERRLGRDGVLALMDLWAFCANTPSRRAGDLTGMDDEDITLAANYPVGDCNGNAVADADYAKKCAAFVAVLAELRLLDGAPGAYRVHDFEENNPHVASASNRSLAAKANANMRWHKDGKHKGLQIVGCKLCEEEAMQNNANHANACETMQLHAKADAPVSVLSFPLQTDVTRASDGNKVAPVGSVTVDQFEEILSSPPYCWKPPKHTDRGRIEACCPVPRQVWDSAIKIALEADKPGYAYFASVLESESKPVKRRDRRGDCGEDWKTSAGASAWTGKTVRAEDYDPEAEARKAQEANDEQDRLAGRVAT